MFVEIMLLKWRASGVRTTEHFSGSRGMMLFSFGAEGVKFGVKKSLSISIIAHQHAALMSGRTFAAATAHQ
jgi:hypothetical protein